MKPGKGAAMPGEEPHSFGNFTPGFVRELAEMFKGKSVLEIFSGNGLLARDLSDAGLKIRATSLFQGHDGHAQRIHYNVEEMDAVRAVKAYGSVSDVLLMSWPTTTEAAAAAALEWGSDKPIVFVGEITQPDLGMIGLGGCASDFFFAVTKIDSEMTSYVGRNRMDRAVVMRVIPECIARWQAGSRSREDIAPEDTPYRPFSF
jgi:hypothetical protein